MLPGCEIGHLDGLDDDDSVRWQQIAVRLKRRLQTTEAERNQLAEGYWRGGRCLGCNCKRPPEGTHKSDCPVGQVFSKLACQHAL
jgi:hypothetical protein